MRVTLVTIVSQSWIIKKFLVLTPTQKSLARSFAAKEQWSMMSDLAGAKAECPISLDGVTVISTVCDKKDGHGDKLYLVHIRAPETDCSSAAVLGRQAANLLQKQWPGGGSVENYCNKILYPHCIPDVERYQLPCSYLLLKGSVCVG